MNVNVNMGVRVTVSARVSVSVNVCRGLSYANRRVQIHAGLSKSMWRPRADRGPGAGRFVRGLGPRRLCVVLLMQANGGDTPGELHTHHPPPHPPHSYRS